MRYLVVELALFLLTCWQTGSAVPMDLQSIFYPPEQPSYLNPLDSDSDADMNMINSPRSKLLLDDNYYSFGDEHEHEGKSLDNRDLYNYYFGDASSQHAPTVDIGSSHSTAINSDSKDGGENYDQDISKDIDDISDDMDETLEDEKEVHVDRIVSTKTARPPVTAVVDKQANRINLTVERLEIKQTKDLHERLALMRKLNQQTRGKIPTLSSGDKSYVYMALRAPLKCLHKHFNGNEDQFLKKYGRYLGLITFYRSACNGFEGSCHAIPAIRKKKEKLPIWNKPITSISTGLAHRRSSKGERQSERTSAKTLIFDPESHAIVPIS